MNIFLKLLLCLSLCFPAILMGQDSKALGLSLGLHHFTMLDQHASPVVYTINAPIAQIGYQHQNTQRILCFNLYFGLGQLKASDNDLPTLNTDLGRSTTIAGLDVYYWKDLERQSENWQHAWGGSFQYDFMIDFEAVGNFPWAMSQAVLGVNYSSAYLFENGNQLKASVGLPLLGIWTRLPYYSIPRTQGKVPGVGSYFAEGTKLATWNNFQRIDLSLAYQFSLNERWQLCADYQFAWFHYTLPDDIFAYQQQLNLQLAYSF
ncbi:MAG: hypothetical protein AAGI49_19130 [Bacteroidota bacterium]